MVYEEKNTLLMTPGPVAFHPRIYEALSQVEYHHRTPEYRRILCECVSMIKKIIQTQNDVFFLTGSGTAAMDAAIANCISPGDAVLTLVNGKFGERFREIIERFSGKVISLEFERGNAIKPDMVVDALNENPEVKFVTVCHNETSTGVCNPVKKIAQVVKEHDKILIVDGVTSVGGDSVFADKWGFDILITGSQKCLGCPPGLGIIMVSSKAWKIINTREKIPSYYLNLKKYKDSWDKNMDTPYTSGIPLIYAMHVALSLILKEGIEARIQRHRLMAKAFRQGLMTLGLELLAEKGYESNTITAVKYPKRVDDNLFRKTMQRHGVLVAGGQDQLKGKIFRVAHMNLVGEREILLTLALIELSLKELGFDCTSGSGVAVAEEVLLKSYNK
jgi:aspartate aminotransferase-like enzyme